MISDLRFICALLLICCFCSFASAAERVDIFEVDLDQKIPPMEELIELYVKDAPSDYDWKYRSHLNIGNVFDEAFKYTIDAYGRSEVRLKSDYEDDLVKMLEQLPPKYYQYIGPLLHQVPGMSEKILNMPGIKETKNKFPTRIAPQLQHIEDLEFLSPALYFMLMPEAWPGYVEDEEYVREYVKKPTPKVDYDPSFMKGIKELVPEDDYVGEAKPFKVSKSDLRTINPLKNSPLTSADIKAFVNTIGKLNEFGKDLNTKLALIQAADLIDAWERDNVHDIKMQGLKEMVYPCQRLAQKIRFLGMESKFVEIVSEEGFDLKGWAYTCDKTITAHRVAGVHTSKLAGVMALKNGLLEQYLGYDEYNDGKMVVMGQALIDMYTAPIEDVLEVKKNSKFLDENFKKNGFKIINAHIILSK